MHDAAPDLEVHALDHAVELIRRALDESLREAQSADVPATAPEILGQAPAMQEVFRAIGRLSQSHATVLINGESGTGKELVARMVHELGPRSAGPFVPVNCGAIPTELMESEFFGHRKGSFTGASGDKEGLFQAASGGTLFLDEVADLPMHMQVKLLRVIQEKAVRPIGFNGEIPIDVRMLSATHKDLHRVVEQGEFRQDLYYRINVIEVHVPPLRGRAADIDLLADRYLDRIAPEWGIERPQLTEAAKAALRAYAFPGNVRELENILERAIALCERNRIEPSDLRLPQRSAEPEPGTKAPAPVGDAAAAVASGDLGNYIDSLEREAIMKALQESRFNKTKAAAALGITFRALRYKLKKLGIE